ncbi:hypothetical protein DRQ33_08425 [bacterium]|nr:MAG: hypothetical protein DRQ33_08425 [bacterium]
MLKYFLIITFLVAFTFANAISLDSLESWAHETFWGHYTLPDSLEFARNTAIARGDWQIAAFISAGAAFSRFGTIDSAMYDIAYCLAKTGDFEGAEEAIRRARKLYGKNNPQVQYISSLLAIWSGNASMADDIIQSALRKAPSEEARQFLQIAGGIISTLKGDIKSAFKMFKYAENISKKGTGRPRFEARMLGQSIQNSAVLGTLYIRQHYGRPCVVLRMRPVFDWQDG